MRVTYFNYYKGPARQSAMFLFDRYFCIFIWILLLSLYQNYKYYLYQNYLIYGADTNYAVMLFVRFLIKTYIDILNFINAILYYIILCNCMDK